MTDETQFWRTRYEDLRKAHEEEQRLHEERQDKIKADREQRAFEGLHYAETWPEAFQKALALTLLFIQREKKIAEQSQDYDVVDMLKQKEDHIRQAAQIYDQVAKAKQLQIDALQGQIRAIREQIVEIASQQAEFQNLSVDIVAALRGRDPNGLILLAKEY